jgi:hypothetical protein
LTWCFFSIDLIDEFQDPLGAFRIPAILFTEISNPEGRVKYYSPMLSQGKLLLHTCAE